MLRHFPRSLLFAVISIFILLNVCSATASAQEPSPAATPTPLSDDVKRKIADVETAIKNSDAAIKRGEERRQKADAQVNTLKRLTSSRRADEAAMRDLEDLVDLVADVDGGKFYVKNNPDNDHIVLKDLDAVEQKLTAAKNALPSGGTQPPEVVTAASNADAAGQRLTKERSAVTKTRDDLRNAVGGIFTFASGMQDGFSNRVATLVSLDRATPAAGLRTVLPQQLPNYRSVEQLSRNFKETWGDLSVKLRPLGIGTDPQFTGIDTKQTTLRSSLRDIRNKLVLNVRDDPTTQNVFENDAWLVRLARAGLEASNQVEALRNNVRLDPVKFSGEGVQTLRDNSPLVDDLRSAQLEWVATEVQLAGSDDLDFQTVFADDAANRLEASLRIVKAALSDLQDALAGDMSKFEADQISLFYFTDIPRLMLMLNSESHEIGGIQTASEEAAARRRELTNADLDLADAQSAVNAAQQRVVTLREELRQANAATDASGKLFKRTTQALKGAQRDKQANDKRFTDGQCDPMPTDPEKRAKCESLAVERDRASARFEEADQRNKDAEEDKKRATERSTALRDEQNGLPSKIAEAESKLSDAQASVNRQRRSALLAAQAESEAFVKARDNRPFWVAPVNGTSTDPVKHVFLWAFNDSKTVFMRGPRSDLEYVKCIIAKIDQPAPQARMTLWTLELSSDSSVGGAKKTNESLELVDRHLSNSRALNAAALSTFRDAINERVAWVADRALREACPAGPTACPDGRELAATPDNVRLARLKFYNPEVLKRLGFDPDHLFDSRRTDPLLARLVLPDPAGTTTLGEALMVLSLGQLDYRQDVMTMFLSRLSLQLPELGLRDLPEELQRLTARRGRTLDITWFPSLRRAINLDGFQRPDPASQLLLSREQLEILRTLLPGTPEYAASVIRNMSRAGSRAEQISIARAAGLSDGQAKAIGFLPPDPGIVPSLTAYKEALTAQQLEILHSMQKVAQENLLKYTKVFIRQYIEEENKLGIATDVRSLCPTEQDFRIMASQAKTREEQEADEKARGINPGQTPVAVPSSQRSEREQRDIKALINRHCAMATIFQKVTSQVMTSGELNDYIDWQRKKIRSKPDDPCKEDEDTCRREEEFEHKLWKSSCTNGLRTANAREAAADQMLKEMIIAVEDDLDRLFVQPMLRSLRKDLQRKGIGVGIVQRTSVLATNRLLARVEPRASAQLPLGQQTDVLQAAQQLSEIFFAAQGGGPLGALGALQSLPRTPQAELFGLTTGNVFQVTPVFDPSGQALRFRFDYILQSMIQEPNGTVNPQLPRIERHTVNTEVQLSNLELREISRYESNARLGIATRYAGGLPIFKDLPYVRYIPLIGWFVRTSGKAAVTQESLIFGQTTMYPTIGDIMGLLTTEPTVDISREP